MVPLAELLRALKAPEEMVRWTEREDVDAGAAFDRCERGDWTLWLLALMGVPITELVATVTDFVERLIGEFPKKEVLNKALETIRSALTGDATIEDCTKMADIVREIAEAPPTGFPSGPAEGFSECADVVVHLLEAAGILLAARQIASDRRMERAQQRASISGGGVSIFLEPGTELRLHANEMVEDPVQPPLRDTVELAATALAMAIEAQSQRRQQPSANSARDAREWLAARLLPRP